MKKYLIYNLIGAVIILFTGTFVYALLPVEKLSLEMNARTLQSGKYVTVKGEVYYRTAGGKMVTHISSPFNQIIFADQTSNEMKTYDPSQNTVVMFRGDDYSSKQSFIYQFLNGDINTMGLADLDLKVAGTKMDNGTLVTTWVQKVSRKGLQKVIVAHENNLPVYMGFFKEKNVPLQKIYYTNYQRVGNTMMPMNFTEIVFMKEGKDSIITRRLYSNLKLNRDVADTYLEYIIPSTAKLISADDFAKQNPDNKK